MHCELVIPGLVDAAAGTRLPAAELLLARGRKSKTDARSLEDWLLHAFRVDGKPCPAGALTALAHNMDAAGAAWVRADPVHLQLMRDRMTVVPSEAFTLPREEADALCGTLNRHFANRLELVVVDPGSWIARISEEGVFHDSPPLEMAGRGVQPGMAGDALMNEAQMALHEHPVNEAREARGELALNSLWLWGAGKAPGEAHGEWQSVSSTEPIALGLARLAGIRHRSLPGNAASLLDRSPEEGRHLVVMDALRAPLALGDAQAARSRLDALEEQWIAPLLAALRSGRIGMLSLHVPDAGRAAEATRADLRRFWRLRRPVSTMAA